MGDSEDITATGILANPKERLKMMDTRTLRDPDIRYN